MRLAFSKRGLQSSINTITGKTLWTTQSFCNEHRKEQSKTCLQEPTYSDMDIQKFEKYYSTQSTVYQYLDLRKYDTHLKIKRHLKLLRDTYELDFKETPALENLLKEKSQEHGATIRNVDGAGHSIELEDLYTNQRPIANVSDVEPEVDRLTRNKFTLENEILAKYTSGDTSFFGYDEYFHTTWYTAEQIEFAALDLNSLVTNLPRLVGSYKDKLKRAQEEVRARKSPIKNILNGLLQGKDPIAKVVDKFHRFRCNWVLLSELTNVHYHTLHYQATGETSPVFTGLLTEDGKPYNKSVTANLLSARQKAFTVKDDFIWKSPLHQADGKTKFRASDSVGMAARWTADPTAEWVAYVEYRDQAQNQFR